MEIKLISSNLYALPIQQFLKLNQCIYIYIRQYTKLFRLALLISISCSSNPVQEKSKPWSQSVIPTWSRLIDIPHASVHAYQSFQTQKKKAALRTVSDTNKPINITK